LGGSDASHSREESERERESERARHGEKFRVTSESLRGRGKKRKESCKKKKILSFYGCTRANERMRVSTRSQTRFVLSVSVPVS
ncbi:hypothetical protein AMELA_G00265230, partial [Ameiurus melas]